MDVVCMVCGVVCVHYVLCYVMLCYVMSVWCEYVVCVWCAWCFGMHLVCAVYLSCCDV